MKRRHFLKGAVALVASPSLPVKAIASLNISSGTAVATAKHKASVDLAYFWCKLFAENKPNFRPEMLSEYLGFSKDVAGDAFKRLLKNDIVKQTTVPGIYKSTKPFVDMSHIYEPTKHFSDVVAKAKSNMPEIPNQKPTSNLYEHFENRNGNILESDLDHEGDFFKQAPIEDNSIKTEMVEAKLIS